MAARIYRPARTAMSSGQAKTIEPLMGYTSSADMRSQVRLQFDTKEAAIAYAERNGLAFRVFEPKDKARAQVAYSDNFRRDRAQPWTH